MNTLPGSARAVVISTFGGDLEVREYPVAPPLPGGLLVRVRAASLCGSDIHLWEGAFGSLYPPPLVPGHEAVGEIVAFGAGPKVDSTGVPLAIGDRVIWEHEACGHCEPCSILRSPNLCVNRTVGMLIGADNPPHIGGNLAEYTYVWPRSGRVRVPDTVQDAWAAAASCALRTVVRATARAGAIDYRHTVVIQGAGPLGLFATALVATRSPRRLIVIGGPDDRLEIAKAYGADEVVSVETHDADQRVAAVQELLGGGPDIVMEMSGGRGAVGEGVAMAGRGGRYVVVGSVFGPPQPVLASAIVNKDLTLLGSTSAEVDSFYHGLQFLDRFQTRFDWDLLTGTRRYRLEEASIAFRRMSSYEETKAVFVP